MSGTDSDDEQPGGLLRPERADATVLRMLLGGQLRRFARRQASRRTRQDMRSGGPGPRSAGWRTAGSSFKGRDVADLLTLYGVTDEQERNATLQLASRANVPGWWAKYGDVLPDWLEMYLGLEASASVIRTFELQFVHGLLQTSEYARAVTTLGHKSAPGRRDRAAGEPADAAGSRC